MGNTFEEAVLIEFVGFEFRHVNIADVTATGVVATGRGLRRERCSEIRVIDVTDGFFDEVAAKGVSVSID